MLTHKGTVELETERLILKRLTVNDSEQMFKNWASDENVAGYMSWNAYKTVGEVEKNLLEWQEEYKKDDTYYWGLYLKAEEQFIGTVYLLTEGEIALVGSLSYCIGERWQNKGYMTEAVKRVIDFAINEIGFNRIEAYHAESNVRSGRVMQKCGMKYEGVLRQRCFTENGFEDCVYYSILKGDTMKNYYGSLCTEMYEIIHKDAPEDELAFYLSYAEKGESILEALCGSGRFFVPFMEKSFAIKGLDNSSEMLGKLCEKRPDAVVFKSDIESFETDERFDYIFISSGSVSLFTDMQSCKSILRKMKSLLKAGGKFVFAVDTVFDRCEECDEYKTSVSVKTKDGFDLLLKSKAHYDENTHTQFGPAVYELYNGDKLLQSEKMDFQTHLYELGEMEAILSEIGFNNVKVYSDFDKNVAVDNNTEMFLFECTV